MSNMVVRTNVFALNAHRNLTNVGLQQRQAAQRLSSGFRINSAADDAAGLAISESMRAQIRGLDQASINAQDGVGLIQTAEGAMATVSDMVIRVRELMVQAANDTNTFPNREKIQLEIDQIMTEINDVTFRTQFNTRTLLDGGLSGGGGPTSAVSLQWMLFSEARTIGLPTPGGTVGPGGMHPNPNDMTETSLRNQIIGLQSELRALAGRVGDRLVSQGAISDTMRDDLVNTNPPDFSLIDGSSTIVSPGGVPVGMIPAEYQQMRTIQNRLDGLLRSALESAQNIFSTTSNQIIALGGVDALNGDGSRVFLESTTDVWNDRGREFNSDYSEMFASDGTTSLGWASAGMILASIPAGAQAADFTTVYDSNGDHLGFVYTADFDEESVGGRALFEAIQNMILGDGTFAQPGGLLGELVDISDIQSLNIFIKELVGYPGAGGPSSQDNPYDATIANPDHANWFDANSEPNDDYVYLPGLGWIENGTITVTPDAPTITVPNMIPNTDYEYVPGVGWFNPEGITFATVPTDAPDPTSVQRYGPGTGATYTATRYVRTEDIVASPVGDPDDYTEIFNSAGESQGFALTANFSATRHTTATPDATSSERFAYDGSTPVGYVRDADIVASPVGDPDDYTEVFDNAGTSLGYVLNTNLSLTQHVEYDATSTLRYERTAAVDGTPGLYVRDADIVASPSGDPDDYTEVFDSAGNSLGYVLNENMSVEQHTTPATGWAYFPGHGYTNEDITVHGEQPAMQDGYTTEVDPDATYISHPGLPSGWFVPDRYEFLDDQPYRLSGGLTPADNPYTEYIDNPDYVNWAPSDLWAGGTLLNDLETIMRIAMDVLADVNLESNAMWFQIGANSMQGMILQLKGIHTGVLGGGLGDLAMLIDVRQHRGEDISSQLVFINAAEGVVNGQRAQLGAIQNRLEFTRQSLDISSENLSAAESRVRDTDMAREMMRFTQAQVLQQAGISMLAQANQLPASILQLLQ